MLKPKILPRFYLAVTVSAAAFLLLAVPPGNTESGPVAPPDDSCADLLGFYEPFSGVNKMLYWAGNVAARDITSRAKLQFAVPLEELPKEFLSEDDYTKIAVKLKGEDDYAVMNKEFAGKILANYSDFMEFHSGKDYSEMKASYGLVVSIEQKDLIETMKGMGIEVQPIISWKQHPISYKTALSDSRIQMLIDANVFDGVALSETFVKCK